MGNTVAEIRRALQEADGETFAELDRRLAGDGRKGVVASLEAARKRLAAEAAESERIAGLYAFDEAFLGPDGGILVGLDEVGRGSVAGPLAVGAVVLPREPRIAGLNDSKQVAEESREAIAGEIRACAIAATVFYVEPEFIDSHGMAASLRRAFSGALAGIEAAGVTPDVVLIDGNPLGIDSRERTVVKGDAKSASIAAASILAKVTRDDLMRSLDAAYPRYGFSRNKGYASADHRDAIKEYGLSPVHRASFCKSFMQESLF